MIKNWFGGEVLLLKLDSSDGVPSAMDGGTGPINTGIA